MQTGGGSGALPVAILHAPKLETRFADRRLDGASRKSVWRVAAFRNDAYGNPGAMLAGKFGAGGIPREGAEVGCPRLEDEDTHKSLPDGPDDVGERC